LQRSIFKKVLAFGASAEEKGEGHETNGKKRRKRSEVKRLRKK